MTVADSDRAPSISVVMPMYNAASMIQRCLAPLEAMLARGEIIDIVVVDDASTDSSADIVASRNGVQLLRRPSQGGPGSARNQGAEIARGTYLWFVDSDVIAADDAARVIRDTLASNTVAALMGSYDDDPAARNFLSQYKNLVHRYYHQRARTDASTFWAGCGVVQRELFTRLGGFDAARFRFPSIEDIELGYRIRDAGGRILLVRNLHGKHLKEWRLRNLVHTEIFRRAVPWTSLMLARGKMTDDLNVSGGERIRAAGAALLGCTTAAFITGFAPPWLPALVGTGVLAGNSDFLRYFTVHRGPWFAARALAFHQFYYLYSSAAFAWAMLRHRLGWNEYQKGA
jgi:GT2 family glycosyltransferase